VLVRIEGHDLPGLTCGPGPDFPHGHHNIHVAVQGNKGQQDLLGLVPADVPSTTWELECTVVSPPPEVDLRGRQIQGPPGARFIYITWGVVADPRFGADSTFTMFRRAKLRLSEVPVEVMAQACNTGLLVGRLGLSDDGWPICAAVRPQRIAWSVS
jgi:hypothetical protein